jgi:hypothetical protein
MKCEGGGVPLQPGLKFHDGEPVLAMGVPQPAVSEVIANLEHMRLAFDSSIEVDAVSNQDLWRFAP